MQIVNKGKRKAISPVLATVILIAITLIAAIAIAGFVFGLFGSFTSSANVSASVVSCPISATPLVCSLQATNSGTANTALVLNSGSLKYAGTAGAGSQTVTCTNAATALPAGASTAISLSCAFTVAPNPGTAFTGAFSTANGGSIPFSGSFP